ncbi:MAG TPA: hypothetical protein VK629_06425 [Steroidobacteraceae bacterium]|nr:hypothetical protein [Steroidobacteraceae bacterium]
MRELTVESDHLHVDVRELSAIDNRSDLMRAYDTIYAYESFPVDLPENVVSFENYTRSRCPLVLQIWPGEKLTVQWFYDAAIFSAPQIDELAADYIRLLSLIATAPHTELHALKQSLQRSVANQDTLTASTL